MSADEFRSSEELEQLRSNTEDDVRSFLLRQMTWGKLSEEDRRSLRTSGLDKHLRRPLYLSVSSSIDYDGVGTEVRPCHCGAEGVLVQPNDDYVHLAFKCGNDRHPFYYSTFSIETVVSLAKACEAAWPGSISSPLHEVSRDLVARIEREIDDALSQRPSDEDLLDLFDLEALVEEKEELDTEGMDDGDDIEFLDEIGEDADGQ